MCALNDLQNHRSVVVTGMGVISALGMEPAEFHAALVDGACGITAIGGLQAGEIGNFAAKNILGNVQSLRHLDRAGLLAVAAIKLALASHPSLPSCELGLVLGTMYGSIHTVCDFDHRAQSAGPAYARPFDFANTVLNSAAGQAAIWHDLSGINSTVATGSTAGLQALSYAADLIRSGQYDVLVAGGVEALCFATMHGFAKAGMLASGTDSRRPRPVPFDARRNGLVLGEGAAFLILEESSAATARGVRILAEIKGQASGYDTSQGRDARRATRSIEHTIELALQDAGFEADEIDAVSAAARGSERHDAHEAEGIARVFANRIAELPVTAIKSMLGETLGAGGPLQTVALVESMRTGVLPGILGFEEADKDVPLPQLSPRSRRLKLKRALVNAVGLDGHACALVLEQHHANLKEGESVQ